MRVHRRTVVIGAQLLSLLGLVLAPASALAAARFGPGLWQAKGRLTGGFHGHGVNVRITGGGIFAFCVDVGRNGAISSTNDKWILRRTVLSEHLSSLHGTGIVTGSGILGGTTSALTMKGTETAKVTLFSHHFSFTQPASLPLSARLPVTTATATKVKGDMAVLSRRAQSGAGFATNERGIYVARPVSRCTV